MSLLSMLRRAGTDVVPGGRAIARAFARCGAERRAALIPFLAAGDPSPDAFVDIALAAADSGADLLELGFPFADSLADGPTIQAAYGRALAAGVDSDMVLCCVERLAAEATQPIVLMTACNPVRARGIDRFVRDAAAAGVSGLLVPDLPFEDAASLREAGVAAAVDVVLLVAPDTPDERAARIARAATGFVYLLRRRGVTGAGGGVADDTGRRIAMLRESGAPPVAVGFGIATPQEAAVAGEQADGVIVGSALVEIAARAQQRAPIAVARAVESFARALRGRNATNERMRSET